jgi:hypothetical protein
MDRLVASRRKQLECSDSSPAGGYRLAADGGVHTFRCGRRHARRFPGQSDEEAGPVPYPGTIVDRSDSAGVGNGVSANSGKKAKSAPQLDASFEGLNHYEQRYSRGGNQFSVEPPDQGLCVGNGYELEVVNDVLNVFNGSGQSVLPDNTATNMSPASRGT